MLDTRDKSLCSPEVVEKLVSVLRPEDRSTAARIISLAVKTRNAVSHGAIVTHSDHGHKGAGRIVVKAIQLLMEVTERHMTSEAAYYRYLNRGLCDPSNPIDDWETAEASILNLLYPI
jgi:hypothetical protein